MSIAQVRRGLVPALAGPVLVAGTASAGISFAPPATIATPGAGIDVLLADLDGDDDLDVATLEVTFGFGAGTATGIVNVLFNDGSGRFSGLASHDLGTVGSLEFAFQRLEAFDMDGDGDQDLATIGTTASLRLLENDGAGGFGPVIVTGIAVNAGPLTTMLDSGDLDGDGDVDLAVALPGQIVLNDGAGNLVATQFTDDVNPQNIAIVDLDGDGDRDIAAGFRVHLNDGSARFTQLAGSSYPGSFARECIFRDLDGDGDTDVVCENLFVSELRIALNDGDAMFASATAIPTLVAPIDLKAGHFDGDGHLDLMHTRQIGSDAFVIRLGGGDGTFGDAIVLPLSNSGTYGDAGDLNGDGLDDLVLTNGFAFSNDDESISVLLNAWPMTDSPADLDGDGSVGFADLSMLLGDWGPCPGCAADLDGNGVVGFGDLNLLLGSWGPCAP